MTEPAFREIHLSAKQLVFLFISVVVVGVVVFLLGVSVGRGIGPPVMQAESGLAPGDTLVATEPAPGEESLPGTGQAEAAAAAEVPAPAAARAEPPIPAAPPPPEPDPPAAQATPPVTENPPVAGGDWVLQVGAFGARQNADALMATLKQRGYPVYIERTSSTTVPFAVRVGPYASRGQAEAAMQRLTKEPEGLRPLIIR